MTAVDATSMAATRCIALRRKFFGGPQQAGVIMYLHQGLREQINGLGMKIVAHEDSVCRPDQVQIGW
jgi:hypothetical protein